MSERSIGSGMAMFFLDPERRQFLCNGIFEWCFFALGVLASWSSKKIFPLVICSAPLLENIIFGLPLYIAEKKGVSKKPRVSSFTKDKEWAKIGL